MGASSFAAEMVSQAVSRAIARKIRSVREVRASSAISGREVLPAAREDYGTNLARPWYYDVVERIESLSVRPTGWDSYGGNRLAKDAVIAAVTFLSQFSYAIQSKPSISLTSEGGLLFGWEAVQASVELVFNPQELPWVYYINNHTGAEWEGFLHEGDLIEKWLWQASSVN